MDSKQTAPFHAGERAVQERLGVRERVEQMGRAIIRDFMPEQHRDFFSMLPFIVVGAADAQGRPWASILEGTPGFVTSPDPGSLEIHARPADGDPLAPALAPGADLGLLGIEFATRRRNRVNGVVEGVDGPGGIRIRVKQSFGNCPKYIQARAVEPRTEAASRAAFRAAPRRADHLDAAQRSLVERADTFFIASVHENGSPERSDGVDVSHRGGRPGFVKIENERALLVPDYVGNFMFNTLGNLVTEPRAGLVFVDFASGDLLHLAVRAEILWEGPEVDALPGARRALRFRVDEAVRRPGALGLRGTFLGYAPNLPGMAT
ncbi:MAG: pyridoxamine 5'-phosphate oxidase family protein [Myxococcales bacterium]|nr:pyridoxamine 5'-phosphate oxidase family protein [Myxococcales bacterium]